MAGLAFGYFIALPAAVHFLTDYDSSHYNILIRARDYYSFVITVLFAVAIVFELPIFVLGLARLGILPSSKLRRNRRIGYVLVAALAVALPGVDPVTTLLEMAPLMVLFESVDLARGAVRAALEGPRGGQEAAFAEPATSRADPCGRTQPEPLRPRAADRRRPTAATRRLPARSRRKGRARAQSGQIRSFRT